MKVTGSCKNNSGKLLSQEAPFAHYAAHKHQLGWIAVLGSYGFQSNEMDF